MRNKVLNSEYYKNKFIEKANKRHNNKYDYSMVKYINSTTKVEVICNKHGSFFVRPDSHVRKVGCSSCNGGIKYDNNIFIEKAKKIHGDLYDYSNVIYINSIKKVKIICKTHGLFEISPANHLVGQKCPSCSGVKKKTRNDFILESIIMHNNKYDYSDVEYINNSIKIKIICPKHGGFFQLPKYHLRGHGCSKCSNFSKGELKLEKILNDMKISYIREHRFEKCISKKGTKLPFDFYLPDYNICLEYDGRQHFEPVDIFGGKLSFVNLKNNDKIRDNWCFENDIKLIRISYNKEKDDINNLLRFINYNSYEE
jgi:very-short-patch-repair endonuclease